MPKVIPPLTDTQCKKLRYNPTEKSANRLRDGRGLILEARSSGRKVWLLEYKLGKKRSYATMPYDYGTERGPLAAARQWREQQQTLVAEGIDPNEYSKRQRVNRLAESDRLFKAVSEEWIAHKEDSGKWGLKQQKKVTGIVRNHLQPVIVRDRLQRLLHLSYSPFCKASRAKETQNSLGSMQRPFFAVPSPSEDSDMTTRHSRLGANSQHPSPKNTRTCLLYTSPSPRDRG